MEKFLIEDKNKTTKSSAPISELDAKTVLSSSKIVFSVSHAVLYQQAQQEEKYFWVYEIEMKVENFSAESIITVHKTKRLLTSFHEVLRTLYEDERLLPELPMFLKGKETDLIAIENAKRSLASYLSAVTKLSGISNLDAYKNFLTSTYRPNEEVTLAVKFFKKLTESHESIPLYLREDPSSPLRVQGFSSPRSTAPTNFEALSDPIPYKEAPPTFTKSNTTVERRKPVLEEDNSEVKEDSQSVILGASQVAETNLETNPALEKSELLSLHPNYPFNNFPFPLHNLQPEFVQAKVNVLCEKIVNLDYRGMLPLQVSCKRGDRVKVLLPTEGYYWFVITPNGEMGLIPKRVLE